MKQITSNTVLIQGNKSYPAIQTEQGIVWVDKDADVKEGNKYLAKSLTEEDEKELLYSTHIQTAVLIAGLKIYTKAPYKCLDGNGKEYMNYSYTDKWRSSKIIAANFLLKEVPKIELEDECYNILSKNGRIQRKDCNPIAQATWDAFERGYKANQAKYTDEDMMMCFYEGRGKSGGSSHMRTYKFHSFDDYIESLNSIKEITVDENFKIIN